MKLGGIYWATENITSGNNDYYPIWVKNGLYYYTQADNNALNAAKSWGGTWSLPSVGQFAALMNTCSWTWMDSYPYGGENVAGMFVTGTSKGDEIGHSIFLPAFGLWDSNGRVISQEDWGYYWSTNAGQCLYFSKDDLRMNTSQPTTNGMSVRPVSE